MVKGSEATGQHSTLRQKYILERIPYRGLTSGCEQETDCRISLQIGKASDFMCQLPANGAASRIEEFRIISA